MRKYLALMLIIVMTISVFTGCGGDKQKDTSDQSAQTVTIKFSELSSKDTPYYKADVDFKNYVEEQSNGKVTVEIYPDAQLGGDRQAAEAVMLGTIQMTQVPTGVLANWSTKFNVFDLPFLFDSQEAAFKATDGELGQKLNELLPPLGVIGLGYNDNGVRHMTNNARPINEPKDMKGLKMRSMEVPIFLDMFKNLGVNATPMSFSELYTALQQGVVDGQENGFTLVYTSKFYEVQKYMSLTGHVRSMCAVLVNKDFYDTLDPELQQIVADGAQKYLVVQQRQYEKEDSANFRTSLEEAGMQINEITPENLQKFKDAVQPVYDQYRDSIGADMIELAQKANQ